MSFDPRLVLITAANREEARRLARLLLEKRLAACVNIVPGIESHYWWEEKLDSAEEVLLLVKTSAAHFGNLAQEVKALHSYACPEILALAPGEIDPAYRQWWEGALKA